MEGGSLETGAPQTVAESSQHDHIRTGNRRGLHGCPDLKLLDFGRRCSALSREISWAAASLLDTFAADEIGERESGFGTCETCPDVCFPVAIRGKADVTRTSSKRRPWPTRIMRSPYNLYLKDKTALAGLAMNNARCRFPGTQPIVIV